MGFKTKIKSFFALEDDYEYVEEDELEVPETVSKNKEPKKNVVNLKSVNSQSSKVILCEPRDYNEAQEIADSLKNRRAVVINLQRVDHQQAKRIVDFLSGTVYAIGGDIQKLGAHTFLCTPENVDVSGSISDMFAGEIDDQEKRW